MSQLMGWWDYYQHEPWGWEDANWRTGAICSTVTNSQGRFAKELHVPADYYPSQAGRVAVQNDAPLSMEEIKKRLPKCS